MLTCLCSMLACMPAHGRRAQVEPHRKPATPLSQTDLAADVPATVFFHGKLGTVQLRNSAGVRWADGALFWAGMIDVSGYASDVQEAYQFYLVTEEPLLLGGQVIPAGAYGAGIVGGTLSLLDLGARPIRTVPVETDTAMARPRPLQVIVTGAGAVRLYEGRHWIAIERAPRAPEEKP